MKTTHRLLWIAFLLCFTGIANAQDVIVKKDNSTILSKVLEISSTEIKYKKWSNQEGPTYSISVSEVASINYQNGDVEKFSANASNQTYTNRPQQPQTCYSGHMDIKGTHLTIKGSFRHNS